MKHQQGMTLVEIMLVIIVAGFLMMAGIRQYMSYRYDADINTLKYNVNTIMAGMLGYFQANCAGKEGALSPYNPKPPTLTDGSSFTIDIQKDLIDKKYMQADTLLHNALVLGYPTSDLPAGYLARFRLMVVDKNEVIKDIGSNIYNWSSVGKLLLWVPEIMVLMRDTKDLNFVKSVSGAKQCVNTSWVEDKDCKDSLALLFSQSVSFTNSKQSGSNYWLMNPMLNQFRQEQESYNPMVIIGGNLQSQQFYVCGS